MNNQPSSIGEMPEFQVSGLNAQRTNYYATKNKHVEDNIICKIKIMYNTNY